MADVLVGVLGAVTLFGPDGSVLPLRGGRQPALLAALAARAGSVVSADALVELLWPDRPPENPAAALHSAVFKLRASLRAASGRDVLVTRPHGYQLLLDPGDTDADVFTAAVARAREEAPRQAATTLAEALALWRGPAYTGYADTDIAYLEAIRLHELRLTAVERHAAALVTAGEPDEAVALLQPFVAENPLRESGRASLMQALHAVGRIPDALEHYQQHRAHLAEELGLEPSKTMQELQVRLLRGSTTPDEPVPSSTADAATADPAPVGVTADTGAVAPGPNVLPPTAAGQVGLPGLAVRYLRTSAGPTIAYGSTGTGPPLVVLLGWVSSLDVIASGRDPRSSLLERLSQHLCLTLYDRAGTGLSQGPVPDYGLEASVQELMELLEVMQTPVSLLAMSSAGPIAVSAAARAPERVRSLVLFGTFADGPATFHDATLRNMVVAIARSHWGMGSKMLADLYRPGVSDDAAWHLARVLRDSASAEVAAAYLEAMYEQDVSGLLGQVQAPALVLHYRGDRLISFRGGQDLAAGLPEAAFLPLDGRVHLPDAATLGQIERAVVEHVGRHASSTVDPPLVNQ